MGTHLSAPWGVTLGVLLATAGAPGASAQQTLFEEQFDSPGNVPIGQWGPANLIADGWVFDNNSEPLGPVGWVAGCCWAPLIAPLSPGSYLAAYQDAAAGGSPIYSNWAILPAVEGQDGGAVLIFYTISSDTSAFDNASLEVRYAPSGGAGVGPGANDVGDFTTLLLSIETIPNYNSGVYSGWTKWEVELPGPGRIAFRQSGIDSLYFGIDDVSVVADVPPDTVIPEDFEDLGGQCGQGPCALIDKGWTFKNQGSLVTQPAWQPTVNALDFDAYDGVGYIKSTQGGDSGSVATWAVLPALPGAGAGDTLRFFVRGGLGEGASFELRYAPSGGVNTGSGHTGVGDFTQVLYTTPTLFDGWQLVQVTLPGDGALAFRLHDAFQAFFDPASLAAVDALALNPPPLPYPVPQAGQTVTWDAGLSPIEVAFDLVVPPGAEVIVEPGTTIEVAAESTIVLAGTMTAHGDESSLITIDAEANFPPAFSISGTFDLRHAVINANLRPEQHGSLLMDHCDMTGPNGTVFNPSLLIIDGAGAPFFMRIDNCTFDGADVWPSDAVYAVRNSTFTDAGLFPLRGYFLVDDLTFDGGGLAVGKDQQPGYVDDIHVTNAPGAAISLGGSNYGNDYFLGADNTLVGNGYPAAVGFAGILPGSVLPASGNANNAVLISEGFEIRGPIHWGDAGVPYHLPELPFLVGDVRILPGVSILCAGEIGGFNEAPGLQVRGLPDDPVTFAPLGDQAWYGIFTPYRLENTVIDGSEFGIINAAVGLPGFYDGCTFSNNDRAIVGSAIVRKSVFRENSIGADISFTNDLDGQTNPNSFIDNGIGVLDASDATHNWWGDASGPTSPQNPGGQGDAALGGVPVLPFLTTPPSDNPPPVVNMRELSFVVQPGARFIMHWEVIGDDTVTQRVLVSQGNDIPGAYTVVADDLPPSQTSYVFTAPQSGLLHIRVEAVDALGQVGWDRRDVGVAPVSPFPGLTSGSEYLVGYPVTLDESVTHFYTEWMLFDGQYRYQSNGAAGVLPAQVMASTDTARIAIVSPDGAWQMGDYLTVRPDPRLGDAPPTIEVAPLVGAYAGGQSVPISWSAGDDEAVRAYNLQASFDGGLTWHAIVSGLPAGQSAYSWELPPIESTLDGVLVRVVAFDLRFQSSSGTVGPIALTPGEPTGMAGDLNADGAVNSLDLNAVLGDFGCLREPCAGDANGDGVTDSADLNIVLGSFGSSGP